jgi:hypothetical protein
MYIRYRLSTKVGTNFADKWRSLGRHSSLVERGYVVSLFVVGQCR